MAHRNRWFTVLKNGGYFHGYVSHNQMVDIIEETCPCLAVSPKKGPQGAQGMQPTGEAHGEEFGFPASFATNSPPNFYITNFCES